MSDKLQTLAYWKKENSKWTHITEIRSGGKTLETYVDDILQENMRVLNKKYWPYQFTMDRKKHNIDELERWCYDKFKSANWRNYGNLFAFKQQHDASYFLLFWS